MKIKLSTGLIIVLTSTNIFASSGMGAIRTNKVNPSNPPKHHSSLKTANDRYLIKKILTKIEGIDSKEKFSFIEQEYLGKYINDEMILALNDKLTRYFTDQGYLLPQITVNEQDLKKGLLNLKIIISSLSNVIIIGKSNQLMQEYANKILASQPTTIQNTQRYIALMNKIPGYKVSYKLREDIQDEQNKKDSKIDLVIITENHKGEVFANYDNYGVNYLGKSQGLLAAQIFSPFSDSDSLTVNGATTNHPDRLYHIGTKYTHPLNDYGTNLHLTALHAEDNPTKKDDITTEKDNWQNNFSLFVTHPLYLTIHKDLQIEFGTHYKTLANYGLDNKNSSIKTADSKYWSAKLGLSYLFKDQFDGHNLINIHLIQGMGGSFYKYGTRNDLTDKNFNLVNLNIYKDHPLVNNFSIFMHLGASYSDKKLPDQELSILGGRSFGRGYPFCTIDGSKLIAATLETRYNKAINYKFIEQLQPYIFIDGGYVGKQAANTNITNLASTGIGLRVNLVNNIDFGIEAAKAFRNSYIVEGEEFKAKTKVSVFINKLIKF